MSRVTVARRTTVALSDAWMGTMVAAALTGSGFRKQVEIGLTIVADKEMRHLNRLWRGKDRTTDVLAFEEGSPWPVDHVVRERRGGEGSLPFLGDIVVSVPQVRRQAKADKRPFRKEFALMLVHGTLHLLGYDHMTKKDEAKMFPIQTRILKRLGYA